MIEELKKELEESYFTELSTAKGLENISGQICISKNTLRRFLGKMKTENNISLSSINLICKFLNYNDFEDFKQQKQSVEVSILDEGVKIFYDFVKERKIDMSELVFQNINILHSSTIIDNPQKLSLFFKNFKNYPNVLEYVLAWHPTYHRAAFIDYQNILLSYASYSKISHLKVFANSVVILGKFFSEHFNDVDKNIKVADKFYKKMINEHGNLYIFPIARFSVAQLFVLYSFNEDKLQDFISEQISLPERRKFDDLETIIFKVHFADALNVIGQYDQADQLLKSYNEDNFENIWTKYYPEKYKYLFLVCKAMTLLGLKKNDLAYQKFLELKIDSKSKDLPFDIASYIKLQYFTLGHILDEKNAAQYFEKVQKMIEKTKFTRWNQIIENLKP